jgi:hypothetical protein
MNLSTSNFNYMIQNYNDPAAPKNDSKWAMEDFGGFSNSTYPTTFGVFNSSGSSNVGGYDDPQADKLINDSITSPEASAVTAEASYLTAQQPGLFQPNGDWAFTSGVLVLSKNVSGNQASLQSMSENQLSPELWYFTS